MKIKYKLYILGFLFTFLIFFSFSSEVKACDISSFNSFMNSNKEEFENIVDGYSYVIVNNWYLNYIVMFYTNVSNTDFYIQDDGFVRGDRKRISSKSSNSNNNLFKAVILNPNNDNNFVLPSLSTDFSSSISGDTTIINNWNKENIVLTDNCKIFVDGELFIDNSFKPELKAIEFVETLNGYFLRTNILDYNLYCDVDGIGSGYDLYLFNSKTKEFELCDYIERYPTYTRSDGVNTIGIQLYYEVSELGVYHFMLVNKQDTSLKSNVSTFNLNKFEGARILWYDVSAPIYDYSFENGKAVVYTNYIDSKYYNICNLNYVEIVDGEMFYHGFNKNIISKEYSFDKKYFRFKLVFASACSYHCCFVMDGDAGFYISEISTFNIVQSYFDTNGYEEEKSGFGRFGDFLKKFFLGLFVPSSNYLQSRIDSLGEKLNTKIPYKQYIEDFEQLSEIEHENRDITVSADLSNYKVADNLYVDKPKFIDFSFLSKYQNIWFSWIRVVVYIGLIIFNLNMLMKYLRGFNLADGSSRLVNINKN